MGVDPSVVANLAFLSTVVSDNSDDGSNTLAADDRRNDSVSTGGGGFIIAFGASLVVSGETAGSAAA